MRILLDTNILVDWFSHREPFYSQSEKIIRLCSDGVISACIAAHSITDLFFVLRKGLTPQKRREIFYDISDIAEIISLDRIKLLNAVNNEEFFDFEDCLQSESAEEFGADLIITRNVKDFSLSTIKAVTPDEFLTNSDINL